MIDLSFLTEAEQEAILKVLNRDAELKKAEDERVKQLHDVIEDENEYKYKSGQWFYDAKSKRHRDKIHGAELVRASIRKRKKPTTIAELSELNKDSSKRRWVNSVNQDIFIPPELYGVMEPPDEVEEDIMLKKMEGNQSSKTVSFSSPEKEQDKLRNGVMFLPKPRLNPFNSSGLPDELDSNNQVPGPDPKSVQMNGTQKPKSGEEPLYAVVNKTPAASSPSLEQDFDLDDTLMEPRFHGQRGKTQNIYVYEKPLEFGKSFSGGGKITLDSSYPSKKHKENYSYSSEELTPERAGKTESSYSNEGDKPMAITQDRDDPSESVAPWRRHFRLENQEPRQPSPDLSEKQKTSIHILQESPRINVKAEDTFGKTSPGNRPKTSPGEYSKETKYKSVFLQNKFDAEHKPVGLIDNVPVIQDRSETSNADDELDKSLQRENKGRKDFPRSPHFNVMSLKERFNEMPREQMSNPSQFQSLKHFWNVEEKNQLRETTVTSPDKILPNVSSRNRPTRTDLKQRSSEIPADEVMLPNTLDSLSEEEQTSQKVASWLAQTPTVYGVSQMDQNEDRLDSGVEIVEHVQKSNIPKKSDEEFANALQKLKEEALEVPKKTESFRTEEIQIVAQGKPELADHKQTTTDRGFYEPVIQRSNKPFPAKETLSVEQRNEPFEESVDKTVAPEKSSSEFRISFEKPNFGISGKVKKESSLPSEESEAEERIEKSSAPKSQDQQDFISALKKLEIEASKPPPLPDVEAEYQEKLPEEEISQNKVSLVKSSFLKPFTSDNDADEFETPTDSPVEFQTQQNYVPSKEPVTEHTSHIEETIEKSTVPSRNDNEDLSVALKKLELEAIEHQSEEDYVVGVNQEVAFEKPESQLAWQSKLSEVQSDQNVYSSTYGKLPVVEEPIENTRVESQESSADFHNRLMLMEEQAKIPEEPEDLLDGTVKVSQFPNREVAISKKVYSSNESMPISIENSSDHGKAKEVEFPRSKPEDFNDLKSRDHSHSEELANYPHAPEPTGSYTGNGKMLYKKPEVGAPEVANSKPGKPALSESQSDTPSSKNDKYEFEIMKAQDESISKVLDWFSRSSEREGNPPPPVGMLHTTKETSSQILEPGPNANNLKPGPTSYPSPNTAGNSTSRLSVISTQSDNYSDIPNVQLPPLVSLIEDDAVPPRQINSNSEDRSPLQYGESGARGSAKISNQRTNAMHDIGEATYLDICDIGKEGLGSEEESKVTLKQNLIPVATESRSPQELPEMFVKPHTKLSLSSTDTSNGQSDIKNAELLTQANIIENNASPPRLIMSNMEAGNGLEFGKSGGGSGKTSSPSHELFEFKKCQPSLSLSSTESTDHDQAHTINVDLPTPVHVMEEESVPHGEINLDVENPLEFGKSRGGAGKTSPSQVPSEVKKRQSRISLSSTESLDHDLVDTVNVDLPTPVQAMEEAAIPPGRINLESENPLEFMGSGGGSGKTSNQAVNNMETVSQLQDVKKEAFDKGVEAFKDEKESVGLSKEKYQIPSEVEAGTPSDTEKGQLDSAGPPKLEHKEPLDISASQDSVQLNVQQKKVSDMKQLWEGDRSTLPADKRTVVSSSKQTFNSSERAVTPRSFSFESDDQSSPSLVTFKKVMVEEDQEDPMLPIGQLKSFWENENNKDVMNAKAPQTTSVKNGRLDADKMSVLDDSKPKFKKRHTFHSFFEKEPSTSTDKNPPGRSVSVSESTNLKDRQKSTTFQNLRSFWNVDSNAKGNAVNQNDRALTDSKNRQFRSNPDLSKESFVAKIKSKLDSQSLEDIREDTAATSQVQPIKGICNNKNKTPHMMTLGKQNSKENSPSNSLDVQETVSVFQDYNPSKFTSVSGKTQPKSKSQCEISDQREVSDIVTKSVQNPQKVSEFSLRLQKFRDEFSDKSQESTTSIHFESDPQNDELPNRNVENQNLIPSENGDRMYYKEHERKPFLVKQFGFEVAKSPPVDSDASRSPVNSTGKDNAKNDGMVQVDDDDDDDDDVHETVERTLVPPPKHSGDFARGLQKLYNESLEVSPVPDVKLSQKEFMNMQNPEENFSKVLTVSSSKIKSNVQRMSSKEKNSQISQSFHQPIVTNISSKKINVGNEDASSPPSQSSQTAKNDVAEKLPRSTLADQEMETQVHFENPASTQNVHEKTEASFTNENETAPVEKQRKKEIVERIEMPTIVPRSPFNYFDEGIKKLYDESRRDLTATKPVSDSLQALPAKQDAVVNERATTVSQAPDILEQETGETIEKAPTQTQIYQAKSSEFQKVAMNDDEPFIENVASNHVTSEESQPRLSEDDLVEGMVSEMSPKEKSGSVEELHRSQVLQYEQSQESLSETNFTDMSTPMKEKNNSLRRSTLELYLEVPYRREMSKSMDFELAGYSATDVDQERYPLNSSIPTEDTPAPAVNSFPENAETLKRLSQSVPTMLDETDGRDTDSASESSFQIGRHKKSPSSLTNLSGSSGMASMSSVSGSVMSIYSGDFGNVDIKGGIEFSIDYVEQLKEFLIYVYQCRDLAVAEVKKQRSDPYVKAYLLPEKAKMGKRKTAVKKKTLNPVYNEILRYKIPKSSLMAQTLNLSVWHHDALGRNSFLGEVNANLGTWDWSDTHRKWYPLEPRTPAAGIGLQNRGEVKLSLKYIPGSPSGSGTKPSGTGEVCIWIKECVQLPMLREKINSFVKCTVLPDTSRKSRQKTRTVDKTPNPIFNHTMVYDGFKEEDLREACVELTVWDHNRLSNHFLGGLRIGLGTGKSYGTAVDWMDSTPEESAVWEKMMATPNAWVEGMLPLRMLKMAKLAK